MGDMENALGSSKKVPGESVKSLGQSIVIKRTPGRSIDMKKAFGSSKEALGAYNQKF